MDLNHLSGLRLFASAALAAVMAASPAAAQQGGKPLTVAVGSGAQTMDPLERDTDSNLSMMMNIFDALIERDTDGKLVPGLATSWQSVDPTTWRMKLRQGVKFHNGDPFTWQDVKFTIERSKDPKLSEFSNIGQQVGEVSTVGGDEWTIEIKTTKPIPYFAQILPMIFIMDKKAVEGQQPGETAQHPIGTGPYKFVEWDKSSYLKLTANPDYWGQKPAIANVEVRPIGEASTRLAAIASGSVDLLQDVPVALTEAIQRNPAIELLKRPARRAIYLALTNKPGSPGADLRVRQAIAMGINEDEIIQKVMFGHATPAAQIPDPPTIGYSKSIERVKYDPDQAKKLLAEAGFAQGFDITLTGPNDRYVQDAQIEATVAAQLARIGVRVKVVSEPKAVFFPQLDKHDLDFYLIGWFDGSYDFGRSYRQLLHTVDEKGGFGGSNGDSYSDPELDKMFAATETMADPEQRAQALEQLNEAAMRKLAVITLHYQEDDYAVRKASKLNFRPRADTWLDFKELSFGS